MDKQALRQAAQEMGRKGGNARKDALTPARRSAIARKAARARWRTKKGTQ
jgi:hypothetical protein